MTADLLRQAAALMRERAEAVIAADDGDWYTAHFVDTPFGRWAGDEDAAHIAALTPAVALAVADWLEHEARLIDETEKARALDPGLRALPAARLERSVAVARAYLGADS